MTSPQSNADGTIKKAYYKLIAKHTGKCMEVWGFGRDNGSKINQWDYMGNDCQKWRIEYVGNGYYTLMAKHSGKFLDLYYSQTQNGAIVHQWEYNGSNAQLWKIEKVEEDYYKITAQCSGKALEVWGFGKDNGAKIGQWDYAGNDCQKWQLIEVAPAEEPEFQCKAGLIARYLSQSPFDYEYIIETVLEQN